MPYNCNCIKCGYKWTNSERVRICPNCNATGTLAVGTTYYEEPLTEKEIRSALDPKDEAKADITIKPAE